MATARVTAGDWPCYRGANKDGISSERITKWPPTEIWRANVGQGYSCVVVSEGRVYTTGWRSGTGFSNDTVYCFSENSTGANPPPIWTNSYYCWPVQYEGTRATPTVDGTNLYTFSHQGRVRAYNKATGAVLWATNLTTSGRPGWGYAGSPLVEGNLVIVNVGRRGTALNKATGAVVWGNDTGSSAGYASPWAFTRGTQRTVVVHSGTGCYGVDPATGTNLWSISWGLGVCDPILSGDRIWVRQSYGYPGKTAVVNLGSGVLSPDGEPGEWSSTENMCDGENCQVLYNGYVYGPSSGGFRCIDFATGALMWSTDGSDFYMESSVMIARDQLVIMAGGDPNGNLALARATPEGYQEIGRVDGILGGDTWTTPTLANGRLYLRSHEGTLICFDVNGDKDADGLPDDWEIQNFGSTNAVNGRAGDDWDHDGMCNLAEYIAGTCPTNVGNRFQVSGVRCQGEEFGLRFLTQTGRVYGVMCKDDLQSAGEWVVLTNGMPGTGGYLEVRDPVTGAKRYYRIKVKLP